MPQVRKPKLTPDVRNANRGTDRGRQLLEQSLRELGAGRSILVDKAGRIIAGNKTYETWQELSQAVEIIKTQGDKLIVVQREDLDLDEPHGTARRLAYYDNRTSELDLDWNIDQVLADLDGGMDLGDLWSAEELDALLAELQQPSPSEYGEPPEPQIDRAAELQAEWGTALGQVWELGRHRVVCGDCTDENTVHSLMADDSAVLMATDPPYGDSWVAKAKDMHMHGYGHSHAVLHGSIASDDLSEDDLYTFLRSFLAAARFAGDPPFPCYVWHRAKRLVFERALVDAGYHVHQPVVWVKPSFVIGRLHYHPRCEWALHGWLQGNGSCPFYGERNQSDVWEIARENDKIHPTQKPVDLFAIPVLNHTKADECVYEPFLGSGTMLMACEQLARQCRAIEIAPEYVAVTLQRWHDMTGEIPQCIDTN